MSTFWLSWSNPIPFCRNNNKWDLQPKYTGLQNQCREAAPVSAVGAVITTARVLGHWLQPVWLEGENQSSKHANMTN